MNVLYLHKVLNVYACRFMDCTIFAGILQIFLKNFSFSFLLHTLLAVFFCDKTNYEQKFDTKSL